MGKHRQKRHDAVMTFKLQLDAGSVVARPSVTPPTSNTHKYLRGHAIVMSGPVLHTGASRLAAQAALTVGAGLVSLLGDRAALSEHAAHVTAIMLKERDAGLSAIDNRVRSIAVGPGAGLSDDLIDTVLQLLRLSPPVVLDADALTVFEGKTDRLFRELCADDVMTPHAGEFARLFPAIALGDPVTAAVAASRQSGSVVLLKGHETVVASPSGQWAVNRHSSPWLATAGSGDVLTGMICGLLAQGVPSFDAAAIAAWLHGDIGMRGGAGLTADAMPGYIPLVLQGCLQEG